MFIIRPYRQRLMLLLKELRETQDADVSYQALSPYGETLSSEIKGCHSAFPQPPSVLCPLTPVRWTFTFSAKEKDSETGLSYFGSRYYSSDLSIWLSVDPMSGKYPSTSPYAYCRNKPIILIDQYGKFDTRAEARQYRKEHHTGGIVKKNSEMDNFAGKYSIDNKREYVSYTKPQHIEDDASTHLHGLSSDGVVKSPIAHDPRTGSKKFDDFENKMTQTGIAVGQGLATALPITSQVNDIMILRKGENLFDDKATESDKAWAIIDLATLGVGKTFKLLGKSGVPIFEKAADIIEDIGMGLGAHSGILTTKNKSKNGEKRKK